MFFGSYGHRYSDPLGTFAGFDRESVEDALDRAVEFERDELPGYCDLADDPDHVGEDCALCNPDIVTYGVYMERTPIRSGFVRDFCELLQIAREIKRHPNNVAALER